MGAEREARHEDWKAKQAAWEAKQGKAKTVDEHWDLESTATEATTAASVINIVIDDAEVERRAMMDKTVRKFGKVLRDMAKLEGLKDLDVLQKEKLKRKPEIEMEFEAAKAIAKVRARHELKCKMLAEVA